MVSINLLNEIFVAQIYLYVYVIFIKLICRTGRNDRPHWVSCRACRGLCPNRHTRHKEGSKIPKQSSAGEFTTICLCIFNTFLFRSCPPPPGPRPCPVRVPIVSCTSDVHLVHVQSSVIGSLVSMLVFFISAPLTVHLHVCYNLHVFCFLTLID